MDFYIFFTVQLYFFHMCFILNRCFSLSSPKFKTASPSKLVAGVVDTFLELLLYEANRLEADKSMTNEESVQLFQMAMQLLSNSEVSLKQTPFLNNTLPSRSIFLLIFSFHFGE